MILSFILKSRVDIANEITDVIKMNEKDIAEYEVLFEKKLFYARNKKHILVKKQRKKNNNYKNRLKT